MYYAACQDSATRRTGEERDDRDPGGIGRIKRDISELINRVAHGGERIVFTSRGKPKALVRIDDMNSCLVVDASFALRLSPQNADAQPRLPAMLTGK